MKKSIAAAVLAVSSAFALPAGAQTTPYKVLSTMGEEKIVALQACSADGKTVEAHVSVVGTPSNGEQISDHLVPLWKTVAARHDARELAYGGKATQDEFNMLADSATSQLKLTLSAEGRRETGLQDGVIGMQGVGTIIPGICKPQ